VKKRGTTPANNFYPQKRERKKKRRKKRIYSSNSQRSGGCQGFLSEYYPTNGRCGDCDKNPEGLTFTAGKRSGYLCIFIFFGGKRIMLSFCIELYCVEFILPAKSRITCFELHYIELYYNLPEGLKNTNCPKY